MINHKFIAASNAGESIGDKHRSLHIRVLPGDLMHVVLKKTIIMMGTTLDKIIVTTG